MANKTEELRKALRASMLSVTDRVYFGQAPDNATYPYIVFDLSELIHQDGKTLMEMEVNVLDYGTVTTTAENIADEMQALLDRADYINAFIQYSIYRGLRQPVEEEDKQLIRRRLTFEIHLHERRDM